MNDIQSISFSPFCAKLNFCCWAHIRFLHIYRPYKDLLTTTLSMKRCFQSAFGLFAFLAKIYANLRGIWTKIAATNKHLCCTFQTILSHYLDWLQAVSNCCLQFIDDIVWLGWANRYFWKRFKESRKLFAYPLTRLMIQVETEESTGKRKNKENKKTTSANKSNNISTLSRFHFSPLHMYVCHVFYECVCEQQIYSTSHQLVEENKLKFIEKENRAAERLSSKNILSFNLVLIISIWSRGAFGLVR